MTDAQLQEVQDSPLVLSDQQKQVRADAVLDEATRELYPPESRDDWRRRLQNAAYHLLLTGKEQEARVARARPSGLAGENPFLKALVQYAVHLAWEFQRPREDEASPGLVVPPDKPLLIRR